MEWLNYHHLLYFWTVAREESVTRASRALRLAQPTVSAQIRALEASLGEQLFQRAGRGLLLTEVGKQVFEYADSIFSLGRDLLAMLHGGPGARRVRLRVGVADVLPKLVAYRLLKPALSLTQGVQLICQEGKPQRLLAELALHNLDLVLTDSPAQAGARVRAFHHLLGECGVSLFASRGLADKFRKRFPKSLQDAPFLLPLEGSSLRRGLDAWFESQSIRPATVGEFEDGALIKVFAEAGAGIFAAPSIIRNELRMRYGVVPVGPVQGLTERFYAISIERKLKHPAVLAITEGARDKLFGRKNQPAMRDS
jgi:LysR family transcriptional regulator, transcriptional activator of nhaA